MEQDKISDYQRDGFVDLGVLFSEREVRSVRTALSRAAAISQEGVEVIREDDSITVRSVMGWEKMGGVLDAFVRDERVLEPVESLVGKGVVLHQTKFNPKAPGGRGEKWDPHRGFTFWHFLDGVTRAEGMISVFIALTDQTVKNGAVQTWRGAHRLTVEQLRAETDFSGRTGEGVQGDTASYLSLQIKPESIATYDGQFKKVYLTGPAGTVWLLHSCNLHASPPNESSEVRELVANVYRSLDNNPMHPREREFLCGTSKEPLVSWRGQL